MKSILPINLAFDRVVGNLAQLPFDEGIEIACAVVPTGEIKHHQCFG